MLTNEDICKIIQNSLPLQFTQRVNAVSLKLITLRALYAPYRMYAHAQRISEITKIKIEIPIELNWFSACQEFPTIMKCLVVCVCVCDQGNVSLSRLQR